MAFLRRILPLLMWHQLQLVGLAFIGAALFATPARAIDASDFLTKQEKWFIDKYEEVLPVLESAWPGFNPTAIPKIIMVRDQSGGISHLIAIDHPNPDLLGDAAQIAIANDSATKAHYIRSLSSPGEFSQVRNYDFDRTIGNARVFIAVSNPFRSRLNLANPGFFAATFLHELFHRYQFDTFKFELPVSDTESYDYSVDNLRLALIENELLRSVSDNVTRNDLILAARNLAAVRAERLSMDDRVRFDGAQEMFEGTARYLEHEVGSMLGSTYTSTNFQRDFAKSHLSRSVKNEFGFERFYATGAMAIRLLELIEIPAAKSRITSGEPPFDVLMSVFPVTTSERKLIMQSVLATTDPQQALLRLARELSRKASGERATFSPQRIVE